jgi:hypothetical protein
MEQAGFNYNKVSGTRHCNRAKVIEYTQLLAAKVGNLIYFGGTSSCGR